MTYLSFRLVGQTRAPISDPNPPSYFRCVEEFRISRLAGWFPEDFGNWAIASSTRMWWF